MNLLLRIEVDGMQSIIRRGGLWLLLGLFAGGLTTPASAQYYQTDFPPEEFRARWTSASPRAWITRNS